MLNKTKLKSIVSDYAKEYATLANRSRNAYIKDLKAGDRMPAEGKIYGEEYIRMFAETAQQKGDEALELVERRENEIRGLMAAAPSQDAVNTVSMLKMRSNLTAEELEGAFETYGDNYQTYKVLTDIAVDNNIRDIESHPFETELEGLTDLKKTLNSVFSVSGAENGRLDAAFLSLLNQQIDGVETNTGFLF